MNPHDIAEVLPDGVLCACGKRLADRDEHTRHHGVEMARAALRGEET